MIRSITQKKTEEELDQLLTGIARIFIIGCGTCVTMTHTGGTPEVAEMKEKLLKKENWLPGIWFYRLPVTI